jgi:hypothetical protein
MPDKFGLLAEHVMSDVESVVITIGAGKNDNAEFHALLRTEANADITAEKGLGNATRANYNIGGVMVWREGLSRR